ncbi:Shikimate kinase domain protein [Rhodopirellula maiorica SM1]|uniref:Shikimate kinase n=1 Tax=Rhodopirellula maiorica SM1 TaxID=1265738 RepID=M5RQM4_9BACT|nr:shikimate kinase [Rhodopirellula maiorica]EMI21638.1 Shikimate kinase domain protein [Rhodopirellula maiorica SM1]
MLLTHLYLTGYRGTGKTSVATRMADAIGCPVVDLDVHIQDHAGCSIREIFADSGEQGFRDLESEMLDIVAAESPCVVALGGGAILRESNRKQIQTSGHCIWLIATAEMLAERIAADSGTAANRPALTQLGHLDEIRELLAYRQPLYQEVADVQIDTSGKTLAQVSDEALQHCREKRWC